MSNNDIDFDELIKHFMARRENYSIHKCFAPYHFSIIALLLILKEYLLPDVSHLITVIPIVLIGFYVGYHIKAVEDFAVIYRRMKNGTLSPPKDSDDDNKNKKIVRKKNNTRKP